MKRLSELAETAGNARPNRQTLLSRKLSRKSSSLENLEQRLVLSAFTPQLGDFGVESHNLREIIQQVNSNGEDDIILDAHLTALANRPKLKLILAPRHPKRAGDIARKIASHGLTCARRSAGDDPTDAQVYLADTFGEMHLWYQLAGVTFVAGSLTDRGGHTPYEPAAFGSAILYGPDTGNFRAAYDRLSQGHGAICTPDAEAIANALTQAALERSLDEAGPIEDFESFAGHGIAATIDGTRYWLGEATWVIEKVGEDAIEEERLAALNAAVLEAHLAEHAGLRVRPELALDIHNGPVIALVVETGCRYHAPLAFPDDVEVALKVARIGTSSVTWMAALFGAPAGEGATAAADAHFTHVLVARDNRRPTPWPDPMRDALVAAMG